MAPTRPRTRRPARRPLATKEVENPLLGYLLAASPPALARASKRPPACAECGLAGGDGNDFYSLEPRGPTLCRICALCRTAAWEPERVRLALIPEWEQGLLNGVVTMLTVNLLRMRAGELIPSGIDGVWQSHLLDTLQHRATATALALPVASSRGAVAANPAGVARRRPGRGHDGTGGITPVARAEGSRVGAVFQSPSRRRRSDRVFSVIP